MAARSLLGALALDALDEFARAVDGIPSPGRHTRLGHLNAPAWTVAHLAASADVWLNVFCRRLEPEAWGDAWFARQREAPAGAAVDTDLDEARAVYARFVERARPYLESSDAQALAVDAAVPQRPGGRPIVPASYLVARTAAHAFAHAGEISVVASLVGAGDLSLPGALSATRAAVRADDPTGTVLAALLHDGHDEFTRVAASLPRPAYGASLERLNAGGFIVAHLGLQQDQLWNVTAGGAAPDDWLRGVDAGHGAPPGAPPFADALAAWRRVTAASADRVDAAAGGPPDGPLSASRPTARPNDSGTTADTTVGAALARSVAHTFVHTGELATIGSIVGAPDAGLPGTLAHTSVATPRVDTADSGRQT